MISNTTCKLSTCELIPAEGDGIKMGVAVGAKTLDLEWVQVHPTGLVNPKDPDAKVKFLAAEALRGVGLICSSLRNNQEIKYE